MNGRTTYFAEPISEDFLKRGIGKEGNRGLQGN
jgi:hypothetical protein